MTEAKTPVVLREEQALGHLADEAWIRQGNLLVSRDSFMPKAANQYVQALGQDTRDALKLRTEPSRTGGDPSDDARQFVLNARTAEAFFEKHGLSLNVQEEQLAGSRKM